MSLTSRLQALLQYANEKTEAGDTTIGAAIKTLCDGYSGASGSAIYPTITDADTLSSRIQALIAYADDTTGVADATLAEAIKTLVEGYGSKPWTKYVQDGLVFQLDCETQCSADTWTDLIGQNVFTSNGAVTLDNGVPYFNGKAYMTGPLLEHWSASHTIEIAFTAGARGIVVLFREDGSNVDNKVAIGFDSGNLYGSSSIGGSNYGNKFAYTLPISVLNTLSLAKDVAIINNIELEISGKDSFNYNSNNATYIGARYSNSQLFTGKIYAIRIYNRLLSEDEIIANQAIDLERFS